MSGLPIMNIPPNQNSLQQMGRLKSNASWRAMYSGEERQKVVQIIINTLTELHGSNPNFNVQRLSKMAQDFEKLVYERSASKEDYLRAIKMKVHQLRVQNNKLLLIKVVRLIHNNDNSSSSKSPIQIP